RHGAVEGRRGGNPQSRPPKPSRNAKYPAKFIFRVYLQRARCTHCRRGALSILWTPAESDDRRRRDELQFSLSDSKRAATPQNAPVNRAASKRRSARGTAVNAPAVAGSPAR